MKKLLTLFLFVGSFAYGQSPSTSINGISGPFTFTGAGVSCTGFTCTFSGGGGGGATLPTNAVVYGLSSTTSRGATTGDIANLYGSLAANQFLASPTGSSGTLLTRAISIADLPSTTLSAAGTPTVNAVTKWVTGNTIGNSALSDASGTISSTEPIRFNGTGPQIRPGTTNGGNPYAAATIDFWNSTTAAGINLYGADDGAGNSWISTVLPQGVICDNIGTQTNCGSQSYQILQYGGLGIQDGTGSLVGIVPHLGQYRTTFSPSTNTYTVTTPDFAGGVNLPSVASGTLATVAGTAAATTTTAVLAGDGSGNTTAATTAKMNTALNLSQGYNYGILYGFGDSTIACPNGSGPSTPANCQFSILAGDSLGLAVDYGVSGYYMSNVGDNLYNYFVPGAASPQRIPKIVMNGGINDANFVGNTTGGINNYTNALNAILYYVGLPPASRIQASACTASGSWVNPTIGPAMNAAALNYATLQNTTNGSTLTCTITTTTAQTKIGIVYVAGNTSAGTFTATIDGTPVNDVCNASTTFNNFGCNGQTLPDSRGEVMRQEYTVSPATSHVVVFTVSSTTAAGNIVAIKGIDAPPSAAFVNPPSYVIMEGVLRQFADALSAATAAYNTAALNTVNTAISDHINVIFSDMRTGTPGVNTSTDMANGAANAACPGGNQPLHPNDCGYWNEALTDEKAATAAGWNIFYPNLAGKGASSAQYQNLQPSGPIINSPMVANPVASGFANWWQIYGVGIGNPAATSIIPGILFNNNGSSSFQGAAAAYDNDHAVIVDALVTSGASAILNCPTFTNYTSCHASAYWDTSGNQITRGTETATAFTTTGIVSAGTVNVTGNVNVQGTVNSTINTNPASITNTGVALTANSNVGDEVYYDSTQTANNRIVEAIWFQGAYQIRFKSDSQATALAALQITGGQAGGVTGITSTSGSGSWAHTGAFSATGTSSALHLIGTGTAPTFAAGAGAGTTPTVTLINVHDSSGTIEIATGTGAAAGVIGTLTFGTAYGTAPNCTFSAGNASAAGVSNTVFLSSGTSNFVITGTLVAATTYFWTYTCVQ